MTFEDEINALVYFHLQEHKSARHLIQDIKENIFAKKNIASDGGISRSSFCETINHRIPNKIFLTEGNGKIIDRAKT